MNKKREYKTFRKYTGDRNFSYKNVEVISKFVSPQGYIVGRDRTGLSQKEQRRLARAIKRARHLAMLPYTQTV